MDQAIVKLNFEFLWIHVDLPTIFGTCLLPDLSLASTPPQYENMIRRGGDSLNHLSFFLSPSQTDFCLEKSRCLYADGRLVLMDFQITM